MKQMSKYFIRGLFTLLPFGLTAYVLVQFLLWSENIAEDIFRGVLSELYFPGLGLILGVGAICMLGFLTGLKMFERVFTALELPFKNVPIVRSIYSAIKSLSDYFSPGSEHQEQQVVVVKPPGLDVQMIGFVTRAQLTDLPPQFDRDGRVAVFMPLSYMVGGLTVFIPRSWITRTDMKVEAAMRSALTAWMPGRDKIFSELDSNGEEKS